MSATKGRRRVCCMKYVHCNESNLSYCTKICGAYTKTMEQTLRDYGVMECGVWTRGLKKYCGAFNSVVLTW